MAIKDIPPGHIPYISPTDLIVFKIYCCGLRADNRKKTKDAGDAAAMLEKLGESALVLTADQ